MADVLIASDAPWVHEEIRSVLAGAAIDLRSVTTGPDVLASVARRAPNLVIVDLQMAQMGGMATTLELRLEQSGGRLPHVPVLMLLDRRADVFLARRSGAEGWLVKPLTPIRIRKAVKALLDGGTYHDESYKPASVAAAPIA